MKLYLRQYTGTWAIWLCLAMVSALVVYLVTSKNPNKFSHQAKYDWHYNQPKLEDNFGIDSQISMALRTRYPLFPSQDTFAANESVRTTSKIIYKFGRQIEQDSVNFRSYWLSAKGIMVPKEELKNGWQNNMLSETEPLPMSLTNPRTNKSESFCAIELNTIWDLFYNPDSQMNESYLLKDDSITSLVLNCKMKPVSWSQKWVLAFSTNKEATLSVDNYTHQSQLGLPADYLAKVKTIGADKYLESKFSSKFSQNYRNTDLCVLAWTNNVFNAIISHPVDQLTLSMLETALKENEGIINGTSFGLLGVEQWQRQYIVRLSLYCTLICCFFTIAIMQFQNSGWRGLLQPLKKMVDTTIYLLEEKQARQSRLVAEAQAREQARKLQAEQEEAREKIRQAKEDQRLIREKQEAKAKELQRAQAQAELEDKLRLYQEMDINLLGQNKCLPGPLREKIVNAWRAVMTIKAADSLIDDEAALEKIDKLTGLINEANRQLEQLNTLKQAIIRQIEAAERQCKQNERLFIRLNSHLARLKEVKTVLVTANPKPKEVRQFDYEVTQILKEAEVVA